MHLGKRLAQPATKVRRGQRRDFSRMVVDNLEPAVATGVVDQVLVEDLPVQVRIVRMQGKTSLRFVEWFMKNGESGGIRATRAHTIEHGSCELPEFFSKTVSFHE